MINTWLPLVFQPQTVRKEENLLQQLAFNHQEGKSPNYYITHILLISFVNLGKKHVEEIAKLALVFISTTKKIKFAKDLKVHLKICVGCHTGNLDKI